MCDYMTAHIGLHVTFIEEKFILDYFQPQNDIILHRMT